jgi:hypothetical protein
VTTRTIDIDLATMRTVRPKAEVLATLSSGKGDGQLGLGNIYNGIVTGPLGLDILGDTIVVSDTGNARWLLIAPTGIRSAPAGSGASSIMAVMGDELYSTSPVGGPIAVYRPLAAAGTDVPVRTVDFTTAYLFSTGCRLIAYTYVTGPFQHPVPTSVAQSNDQCPTYDEDYVAGSHLAMTVTTGSTSTRWSINGAVSYSTAKIRTTPSGTALLTVGEPADPNAPPAAYSIFELHDDGTSFQCLIPNDTIYSDFEYLVTLTDDGAIALYLRPGTRKVELRRYRCG